ncbi:MAG TPA: hypothetical protein VMA73_06165 [Streptosporangiaceae bacterium]|nr:hypothetical protein [Streptosporangiaceae bacterium]
MLVEVGFGSLQECSRLFGWNAEHSGKIVDPDAMAVNKIKGLALPLWPHSQRPEWLCQRALAETCV